MQLVSVDLFTKTWQMKNIMELNKKKSWNQIAPPLPPRHFPSYAEPPTGPLWCYYCQRNCDTNLGAAFQCPGQNQLCVTYYEDSNMSELRPLAMRLLRLVVRMKLYSLYPHLTIRCSPSWSSPEKITGRDCVSSFKGCFPVAGKKMACACREHFCNNRYAAAPMNYHDHEVLRLFFFSF